MTSSARRGRRGERRTNASHVLHFALIRLINQSHPFPPSKPPISSCSGGLFLQNGLLEIGQSFSFRSAANGAWTWISECRRAINNSEVKDDISGASSVVGPPQFKMCSRDSLRTDLHTFHDGCACAACWRVTRTSPDLNTPFLYLAVSDKAPSAERRLLRSCKKKCLKDSSRRGDVGSLVSHRQCFAELPFFFFTSLEMNSHGNGVLF